MNRLVRLCALLLVVPLLMGATCTLTQATPNPNNTPSQLSMSGTYTLGESEHFLSISAVAKSKSHAQTIYGDTTTRLDTQTWYGTLFLVPGIYECYGLLIYHKGNPMDMYQEKSQMVERVVR